MKTCFLPGLIFFLIITNGYTQNTLFKKYEGNPIIEIGSTQPDWRGVHVANAAILTPEETSDGNWRIYIRGSGFVPDYHDQIGILYQDTVDFSPYGPWLEYENNPVLSYGPPGSYDEWHLLDCAPVVGKNDEFYFFYKAVRFGGRSSLAGASSSDGGFTFDKFPDNPMKWDVGANDAVYHDGEYYIYYGDGLWDPDNNQFDSKLSVYLKVTEDPEKFAEADSIKAIGPGGAPDNFDDESVNGARIFYLEDKWYMIYQGSDRHFDFPDRMHAAYSDDLINWTKVDNDFPMFTRGHLGDWDQGAIWYGEVFEYQDSLYMLYEGWGCYCIPDDVDVAYWPGNSRTGIARTSVEDFLLWVDGGFDPDWVEELYGPDGTVVDFEDYMIDFFPSHDMHYEVTDNPFPDDVNSSGKCGKVITTDDQYAFLWSEKLPGRFDFSEGGVFAMDVYTHVPGNVFFKIEHPDTWFLEPLEVTRHLDVVDQWVEMHFDFSELEPKSDLYGRIVLLFDAGGSNAGNSWYFDNIRFFPDATSAPHYPPGHKAAAHIEIIYDLANQQIILEGAQPNEEYVIYSIQGVIVEQGKGKYIDVGWMDRGVYIIRTASGAEKFIR